MKNKKLLIVAALAPLLFQSCSAIALDSKNKQSEQKHTSADVSSTEGIVILNVDDIRDIRSRLNEFGPLIRSANKNLDYTPSPVETFAPDPHYNASGVNKTANNGKAMAKDFRMAYNLGLAYLLTQDPKYASTAQKIIDAWSKTLKSIETRQGKADLNFNGAYLIAAADWTKNANHWDSSNFDKFLNTVMLPNSVRENSQNHGLWAISMEAAAAAYLKDTAKMNSAKNRWEEILENEVKEDGSMPLEVERSATSNWRGGPDKGKKGMAYTHYALLPASVAAKIFADNGIPVWNSKGGKLLQKAFNKAADWTLTPSTFPYYDSNNGDLIGVNNGSYFSLLLRYFPNDNAKKALSREKMGMNGFHLLEIFK